MPDLLIGLGGHRGHHDRAINQLHQLAERLGKGQIPTLVPTALRREKLRDHPKLARDFQADYSATHRQSGHRARRNARTGLVSKARFANRSMVGGQATSVAAAGIVLCTAKESEVQKMLRSESPSFAAGGCPNSCFVPAPCFASSSDVTPGAVHQLNPASLPRLGTGYPPARGPLSY